MKKRYKFIIWAIVFQALLSFFIKPSFALTLQDCIETALRNSKLLSAYENFIKSSIYGYKKNRASLFPQLSVSYNPDYLQYNKNSEFSDGFEPKMSAAVSIDLQRIMTDYPQLSRLEIEKDKLLKEVAENEIKRDVTQNYYRLYILLRKKSDYNEANRYFFRHKKDIEDLQSKGLDVTLDLSRVKIQINTLNISLGNINNEIGNVLLALNSLMNAHATETDFSSMDAPDISLVKTDKSGQKDNEENSSIEDIEKALPDKISQLQQSKLDAFDMKMAQESYRQSKLYFMPTLQLGVDHNIRTIDPTVEEYRSFLSLNVNIFDFGQKAHESRQLQYNYEYQKDLFEDNQRKLKLRIDQLTEDLENLQVIYTNAQENSDNAQKNIDIAQKYYQQGKIKETDLLSTFSDYLNAKEQSYETLYNFVAQKAELDSLVKGINL